MTRARSPVGSRKQRCEICGEPAVASELRQGTKTPLCAVHLALSDPEAAELYARILQIEGAISIEQRVLGGRRGYQRKCRLEVRGV